MININLKNAWNTFALDVNTVIGSTVLQTKYYPFMVFDPDTGRIVMNGSKINFEESATSKVNLYCNTRMYQLFTGLPSIDNGPVGSKNYRIIFKSNYDTNVQRIKYTAPNLTVTEYDMVQSFQEISSIALWNLIASIAFTSSFLPVLPTNISNVKSYNDPLGSLLKSSDNNNGIFNILTYIEVPYSESNQYIPTIDYNPGTEYRLLDMNSVVNLNK
jgi:hypothetical protein